MSPAKDKTARIKEQNRKRAQKYRDSKAAKGSHELRITCSEAELRMIDECCRRRVGYQARMK